jgi:hypothetical protein
VQKARAIAMLTERLEELDELAPRVGGEFKEWRDRTETTIRLAAGDEHFAGSKFAAIRYTPRVTPSSPDTQLAVFENGRSSARALLKALIFELEATADEPEPQAVAYDLDNRLYAAVCMRGHMIDDHVVDPVNRQALLSDDPYSGAIDTTTVPKHCGTCGAPVTLACLECNAPLPGTFSNVAGALADALPFCENCGTAHPWATREQRIGHLFNLIDFTELDAAERLAVTEAIAVLSEPEADEKDPRRVTAGQTLKRLAPGVWNTAQPVIVSVLSAWAQSQIK